MELGKQVCSLELAKRLKELGVKQKSLFYWAIGGRATTTPWSTVVFGEDRESNMLINECAAFTVAELGEMLPKGLAGIKSLPGTQLHVGHLYPDKWMCGYAVYVQWETSPYLSWNGCEVADTEADARAKMLIYLIENNLLPTQ